MIMEINVLQAALLGFFACLASMPGMAARPSETIRWDGRWSAGSSVG